MEDGRVQMIQLYTCTSQLETLRVQEHARTQDHATGRSGGDRSWTRAQTAGERWRWHARGGSAAHARLCARPMARSRMSLRALAGERWVRGASRERRLASEFAMPLRRGRRRPLARWGRRCAGALAARGGLGRRAGLACPASFDFRPLVCFPRSTRGMRAWWLHLRHRRFIRLFATVTSC